MENLAYERIRLFLRTKASDAELKPYVEMAIAAIEARLGKASCIMERKPRDLSLRPYSLC